MYTTQSHICRVYSKRPETEDRFLLRIHTSPGSVCSLHIGWWFWAGQKTFQITTPTTVNVIDGHKTADDLSLQCMLCVGRGRGQRPQITHDSDSDDDDSDLLAESRDVSDDDDDEDEKEDTEAVELAKREGSDYDSDKDPAWRPSSKSSKSPKRAKVKHVITSLLLSSMWQTDSQTDRQCPLDTVADWSVSPVFICCEFVINNEHWC